MRVWHSAWSWLKLIVAAESVAGNTRTGMLTRLILRKPFQVGRAAIRNPPQRDYRLVNDQPPRANDQGTPTANYQGAARPQTTEARGTGPLPWELVRCLGNWPVGLAIGLWECLRP